MGKVLALTNAYIKAVSGFAAQVRSRTHEWTVWGRASPAADCSGTLRISGLLSVEDVKEHQHTEACEQMNKRIHQRHRWNHFTHDAQYGGNEMCRY